MTCRSSRRASVDFYRSDEFGLEGLPFAIFPSMLYYQRDMFDEADLEYPPHAYGDPYVLDGEEVTWDFDTLRELAHAADGRRERQRRHLGRLRPRGDRAVGL